MNVKYFLQRYLTACRFCSQESLPVSVSCRVPPFPAGNRRINGRLRKPDLEMDTVVLLTSETTLLKLAKEMAGQKAQ